MVVFCHPGQARPVLKQDAKGACPRRRVSVGSNGMENNMETNKPEKKFSTGAISAAIWRNESVKDGKVSSFHTVTLQRAYKKGDKWEHTTSLRVGDLPKAALVLEEAFRYLVLDKPDGQEELVV